MKMKVLLIDPWGVNGPAEYLGGLISGLSGLTNLTVVTNYYNTFNNTDVEIKKWFFKASENMENTYYRRLLRGLEYIKTYVKILKFVKNESFDVIHINWMLFYKADIIFLKLLKKSIRNIVYTAHNAIPHISGMRKEKDLRKIYEIVDRIIVHGEAIKSEMIHIFPTVEEKIYIQKHGIVLSPVGKISDRVFSTNLQAKIKKYKKTFLMCGAIYPNKGTHRILEIWINHYLQCDALLIIAGEESGHYALFEKAVAKVKDSENVEIINEYVSDKMMDALINAATVILIPYIHASMSGTVFTAAKFSKTILCTNVGALPEYLEPNTDSFLCDNTEAGIKNSIDRILRLDNKVLKEMGITLKKNISQSCGWNEIGQFIINNIYQ